MNPTPSDNDNPGVPHLVRRNVAPVLADARGDAEMISQLLYGETVLFLSSRDGYALVRCPDGYEGWVPLAAITPPVPWVDAETEPWRVTALLEPLYADGHRNRRQRTLLTLGTCVRIVSTDFDREGWARVLTPDGDRAWIRRTSIEPLRGSPVTPSAQELIAAALRFVGVPYLWGGRSPFGLDCSGFTQRVFGLCGVIIPRDAYQQASWPGFTRVEVGDLEAGDLVFFRGAVDPRGRGITHVGLMLEPPEYIHAAGGTGVSVASLDAESGALRSLSHGGRLVVEQAP